MMTHMISHDSYLPLGEWALTPMGHCKPKEEYPKVIVSTNPPRNYLLHKRATFSVVTEADKKLFWSLYEAERSMYTLRALTGQSRDNSWPPIKGENAESTMTWASEWSGVDHWAILGFRTTLESLGPNSRQAGLMERACKSPTRFTVANANSRKVLNERDLRLVDYNGSNGGHFKALSTVGKF